MTSIEFSSLNQRKTRESNSERAAKENRKYGKRRNEKDADANADARI